MRSRVDVGDDRVRDGEEGAQPDPQAHPPVGLVEEESCNSEEDGSEQALALKVKVKVKVGADSIVSDFH